MNPFVPSHLQRGLILASASPRRREILEHLGFEFETFSTGIEENGFDCGDDLRFAVAIAEQICAYLTTGEIRKEPYPEHVARDLLGGRGLGMYILWTEVPAGAASGSPSPIPRTRRSF